MKKYGMLAVVLLFVILAFVGCSKYMALVDEQDAYREAYNAKREAEKEKQEKVNAAKKEQDEKKKKDAQAEKEADETQTLKDFEPISQLVMDSNENIKDMDIRQEGGAYIVRALVNETAWANSTESQKKSFAESIKSAVDPLAPGKIIYDIISDANQDVVASSKFLGGWDIKR